MRAEEAPPTERRTGRMAYRHPRSQSPAPTASASNPPGPGLENPSP